MMNRSRPVRAYALLCLALAGCAENPAGVSGSEALDAPQELVLGADARSEIFSDLRQSVVALADGGFAAVWERGGPEPRDVLMQWLDGEGRPRLETHGRVVAGEAVEEDDAVIAADPAGGAFVAFKRQGPQLERRLLVQRYDADAHPRWPAAAPVAEMPARESQSNPFLVPDGKGGVFVCFEAGRFVGPSGLRCQRLDASGAPVWAAYGQEVGARPGRPVIPRGVLDGEGGLLIFWRNNGRAGESDTLLVEGQRFSASGARLWGEEARVVRRTALPGGVSWDSGFFGVVSDGAGGAVVSCEDAVRASSDRTSVFAQRVRADGTLAWGEGVVVAAGGHHIQEATIAAGEGRALVAVRERLSGTRSRLVLHLLGPDGRKRWPAEGVEVSDPSAPGAAFALYGVFDAGIVRLVWTQASPDLFESDVMMARFDLEGRRLDPAPLALTRAPAGQYTRGAAYSAVSRRLFAVWHDERARTGPGHMDVWGAHIRGH